MNDIQELKERIKIWHVLNRFFKAEFPDRDGVYHSPFRDDANRSFSIFLDGTLCKDHSTGESLDVIKILMVYGGKSFGQAVSILSDWAGLHHIKLERRKERERVERALDPIPDNYKKLCKEVRANAEKWKETNNVLKKLSLRKRWPFSAVDALIARGCVGLTSSGELCWISERGIALRASSSSQKGTRWLCGKSQSNLFLDFLFSAKSQVCYLCEGQTDSVSILFSGVCKGGKYSVLGIPGAQVKPNIELLKPLKGKLVVLVGDNDKAGRQFLKNMTSRLGSLGIEARHFCWEGLNYNDIGDLSVAEGPKAVHDLLSNSSRWKCWNAVS